MKSLENKRVQNINYIMDDIHDSVNIIYESLMDEDSKSLNSNIKELMIILRDTQKLTEDEF